MILNSTLSPKEFLKRWQQLSKSLVQMAPSWRTLCSTTSQWCSTWMFTMTQLSQFWSKFHWLPLVVNKLTQVWERRILSVQTLLTHRERVDLSTSKCLENRRQKSSSHLLGRVFFWSQYCISSQIWSSKFCFKEWDSDRTTIWAWMMRLVSWEHHMVIWTNHRLMQRSRMRWSSCWISCPRVKKLWCNSYRIPLKRSPIDF